MNNNRTEITPDAVEKAVSGDRKALEELLTGIQDPVFHLSLRMLGSIPDAEDATQEILLKVMTHLSSFRGESAFTTWAVSYTHLDVYKRQDDIRSRRIQLGVEETWEGVHVSGTPDSAYYFSTYNGEDKNPISTDKPKVMILGGGPNRIGQGIEFDYCCVHASLALKKLGFETIIVNCNPETVSTDYDLSLIHI